MAPLKKGSLVRAVAEQLQNTLESKASDPRFSSYIFETNGEILEIRGDYALVRFTVPTPNIWFKLEHLTGV
jgi:hypothetical protein